MFAITAIVFFAGLLFFIIGLISPKAALFWSKGVATRKKSSLIYGIIVIVSFICIPVEKDTQDVITQKNETKHTAETKSVPPAVASPVVEEPKARQALSPKILSPRDQKRELAKRCDTNYTYLDDSTAFDHDTGWIVGIKDHPWYTYDGINPNKWEIQTYETPSLYDYSKTRKVEIYQKVLVRDYQRHQSKKMRAAFITVSPIGSEERYIIDEENFTTKDISQCNLIEKAKNGFTVKTHYKAPADPKKRANKGTGPDDFNPVSIASGSIVLILDYRPEQDRIWGAIYSKSGKDLGSALFDPSTLTEVR